MGSPYHMRLEISLEFLARLLEPLRPLANAREELRIAAKILHAACVLPFELIEFLLQLCRAGLVTFEWAGARHIDTRAYLAQPSTNRLLRIYALRCSNWNTKEHPLQAAMETESHHTDA